MSKQCSECQLTKRLLDFYKEKQGAQGVKGKCKECIIKQQKTFKEKHPEKVKEARTKYNEKPESIERRKLYSMIHKDAKAQSNKKYYAAHREKIAEIAKKQNARNKEILKQYRQNRLELTRRRKRERYHDDVCFRLICNLRSRINKSVKGKNKSTNTERLLGCSLEYLQEHIKSQFLPGMTWQNHGDWHIDHVLPVKMFNLELACEQHKCFHYTNLQPLWAADNLSKSGYFDPEDDTLSSVYLLFE